MSDSRLFSKIQLRDVTLENRVVVSPMCQYSAVDGVIGDWHLMHLGCFSISGPGLIFMEATGVEPRGRISPGCPGLWDEKTELAIKRVVDFCNSYGHSVLGIQLAHAGRKGSAAEPWNGGAPLTSEGGAWETFAPSAVPFSEGWHVPREMTTSDMRQVIDAFVQAAKRAERAGIKVCEIHGAHGYLLSEFLSPLSNMRADAYGGSLKNRIRFPIEVFSAVREAWPESLPLGIRVNATDWKNGGWSVDDTCYLSKELEKHGCDFITISSGGNVPDADIVAGPGYQVGFATKVREHCKIPIIAVGKITTAIQAETILSCGQADLIAIARGALYDPRWVWHAAQELNAEAAYPPQYMRCHPSLQGLPIPSNPPKKVK
ncbi:MAG: oxidoreductase [Magnetovibrio sp.]|nr:oxidoreductase [Magnetovibrio sp.]